MITESTHVAELKDLSNLEKVDSKTIELAKQKASFNPEIARPMIASGVYINGEHILHPISETFTETFGNGVKGINFKEFISTITGNEQLIEDCETQGESISDLEVKIKDLSGYTRHFSLSSVFDFSTSGFQMSLVENFVSELSEFTINTNQILSDSREYFHENVQKVEELGKVISKIGPFIKEFEIYGREGDEYVKYSNKCRLTLEEICGSKTDNCTCGQLITKLEQVSHIGMCQGEVKDVTPIVYKNKDSEEGTNIGLLRLVFKKEYLKQTQKYPILKELTKRIATTLAPIINNRNNSIVDNLTGLYNSRQLTPELNKYISLLERNQGIEFSIVSLDLDGFKAVNDTYGHLAGDHTLSEIGKTITESIRPSDIAIRTGGDEFVLIFPGSPEETQIPIQRIHEQINSSKITYENKAIQIGCSTGVTNLTRDLLTQNSFNTNELSISSKEIIKQTDEAMYNSKNTGKGKITYHKF